MRRYERLQLVIVPTASCKPSFYPYVHNICPIKRGLVVKNLLAFCLILTFIQLLHTFIDDNYVLLQKSFRFFIEFNEIAINSNSIIIDWIISSQYELIFIRRKIFLCLFFGYFFLHFRQNCFPISKR